MAFFSLCLMFSLCSAATLTVTPDRSQFFKYDRITLTCVTNSSGWKVMRTIKNNPLQKCQYGWAIPGESSCIIEDAYPTHTGEYWCESERGERSNRVNLTVTGNNVILESPSHPVFEGENVTLGCSYKEDKDDDTSTSDFEAAFYRNDLFIGKKKPGKMIIEAEEGFYKCLHPSGRQSLKSWLAVRARVPPTEIYPPSPPSEPGVPWIRVISGIVLFILYNIILILCVYTYRKWARAKTDMKRRIADHVLVN
ncbi:Fc receptor-like protein 4 isoform X2 [Xiphophorus hellerii]|uniref:Fc receptor-like protein 4 isoform X2 n=1 Tax=Xiphophorus hellerii TaxID=8084 RepID=UPI0013B3DC67|nr:Fc receptor-like protein 4 isoform X2 [Xiphophorus hellerii]